VATVSDEALVAGMAAGDVNAMRSLVRRYQQRVFGLASMILGDPHAAEDVAQEAFLRSWRHAEAYDPRRASVATWLLTITRNAAIDAARLRRATPIDPASILALGFESVGPTPADSAVQRSEVDRVRRALAELPLEQRQAVILATFFGRTAVEVAEHEQIPVGTAKTRIRTALRRLRERLVDGEVPR
jgi:RNA polymerase sigma-70 factor (ECF subfamily)